MLYLSVFPKLIGIMATPLALKALLLLGGVGLAVAAGLAAVKGLEYGAKRIAYGEDFFIGAQDSATDRLTAAGMTTVGEFLLQCTATTRW